MKTNTEFERIKQYVKKTKIPNRERYDMYQTDVLAILNESEDIFSAVFLAFTYGRAKGFRAAERGRKNA